MNSGSIGHKDWEFGPDIAPGFVDHAKKHIPNYEAVIEKCVRYCTLNFDKRDKIIDVGCATGYTLTKLHEQGFTNLYGVDNSKSMIDLAPKDIANYVVSDHLPKNQYDIVLCNWTLHFVKDKKKYIRSIYDNLRNGGAFILSEKTNNNAEMTRMYHDRKKNLGVSDEEIQQKQAQLENVMFIESPKWYQNLLESMGFTVNVIDADWCFTTWLCRKEQQTDATYLTGW